MSRRAEGLDEFVREHGHGLRRLAHVLTLNRTLADDLTQATFLRLASAWARVHTADDPRAYARKVMLNEHRKSFRRSGPPTQAFQDTQTNPQHSPMRDVEDRIEAIRVLAHVPPRQRAAIALRYLEDRPFKEVAEILGCREATARSLVKRGLDAIRMAEMANSEEVKK